eukprot:COSAG01_NODE_11187_length_1987_cov_2.059322_3_plen_93_part_00
MTETTAHALNAHPLATMAHQTPPRAFHALQVRCIGTLIQYMYRKAFFTQMRTQTQASQRTGADALADAIIVCDARARAPAGAAAGGAPRRRR